MKRFPFALAALSFVPSAAWAIIIPTVNVADVGNPRDFTGHGAVNYAYNIGQTEVTNAQYASFLNAMATTDTYGVYHEGMSVGHAGILRFGSPGSYTYAATPGRENMPAILMRYWDAARFANWLHNGHHRGCRTQARRRTGHTR